MGDSFCIFKIEQHGLGTHRTVPGRVLDASCLTIFSATTNQFHIHQAGQV